MSRCEQEMCPNWAGDDGCPCAVLQIERCTFCNVGASIINGLGEPVCEDHRFRHWHDGDGGMFDRYAENPGADSLHPEEWT